MKKVYLLPIICLFYVISFKQPLFAENDHVEIAPPSPDQRMPPMMNPAMMPGRGFSPPSLLDISELQTLLNEIGVNKQVTEKIITISHNFSRMFDERIISVQREELNIKEELLKDKPDLQSIHTMINKKTQIFSEIEFSQIKRDLEIKSLLTDQEYEKWKTVMIERMHQMGSRFHDKRKEHSFERKE